MKYVDSGGKGDSSVRNNEKIREIVMHAERETTRATHFHPSLISSRVRDHGFKKCRTRNTLKTARNVWLAVLASQAIITYEFPKLYTGEFSHERKSSTRTAVFRIVQSAMPRSSIWSLWSCVSRSNIRLSSQLVNIYSFSSLSLNNFYFFIYFF